MTAYFRRKMEFKLIAKQNTLSINLVFPTVSVLPSSTKRIGK